MKEKTYPFSIPIKKLMTEQIKPWKCEDNESLEENEEKHEEDVDTFSQFHQRFTRAFFI